LPDRPSSFQSYLNIKIAMLLGQQFWLLFTHLDGENSTASFTRRIIEIEEGDASAVHRHRFVAHLFPKRADASWCNDCKPLSGKPSRSCFRLLHPSSRSQAVYALQVTALDEDALSPVYPTS
jgi:hypothetical protein